ncbi:MAG: thioesterase domain-containing protein [Chloroflexota bacterium]
MANLTPAMGQLITDTAVTTDGIAQAMPSLRRAFFVGDVLTRRDVARLCNLAPNLTVVNFYGSTETQRAVSYYIIEESVEELTTSRAKEIVPLGRGVKDAQLILLNNASQLAGIGEVAEIHMRSHHLALRYQGDDAQTAYRFLPNTFTNIPGDRLYRTGDLGRYRPDGNVEFVSRADQQVQIRGFRVELGEINAVLGHFPGVQQALTIARPDETSGHLRLIAYIVPKPGQPEPVVADLRHFLRDRFPMYMVPSAFVLLSAIPMTPNGKIDRRALPDPDWGNLETQDSYATPRNDIEERLIVIWEHLLGVHPVGAKDNFFEIGGHSLLAVRLFVRIEQEFGVNLPLTSLFQEATVRHLANLIQAQTGLSTWSSLVEIHPRVNSERPRFFCVHGVTGDVYWFDALARYIGPDQPFYGLQSRGLDGVQEPLGTVEEMAAHYIREIRTLQPEGPYYIGGYSYGSNVAYEMARQLVGQGQTVALLAILDHMPAKSDYMKVRWNLRLIGHVLLNLPYRFQDFLYLRPDEMLARVRKKLRATSKWAWNKLHRGAQVGYQAGDLIDSADEFPEHVRRVIESNYRALHAYVPQPYLGEVTLLRAKGGRLLCSHDPEMGWGKLAQGGVKVSVVPGSHLRIFKEPHVRHLAFNLRAVLTAAYQEHEGAS